MRDRREQLPLYTGVGAHMLTAAEMAAALGGRRVGQNSYVARCPAHEDRTPSLSLTDIGPVLWHCHAGCSQRDVRDALVALGLWERIQIGHRARFVETMKPPPKPVIDKRGKARWLWQRSHPIQGTVAESYLRCERGISCPLPNTLRFLRANDRHPPSMIAPFVIPDESEPGKLTVNTDHVAAVHITRLTQSGSKHPDHPGKIMLGSAPGVPIVIAPMNDMLGLAITEGIEEALSIHQITGLGAWAAGSAGRMPALTESVPAYTDCVTIFADADTAGTTNSVLLADRLDARNIHVEVLSLVEAV